MGVSAKDILSIASDFVHIAYKNIPGGGVKDAAMGASIILGALTDVMESSSMSVQDIVKSIKRIPDWDPAVDDTEIDALVNGLPSRDG